MDRKVWLFVGSDDHTESLSHIFTLVASARLHGLDPEAYLNDMIRVLPHWPRAVSSSLLRCFGSKPAPAPLDAAGGRDRPAYDPEPLPASAAEEYGGVTTSKARSQGEAASRITLHWVGQRYILRAASPGSRFRMNGGLATITELRHRRRV